ncbi:hypothetical protein LEM8419_01654 [Neolewinella maritima]|uniref:Uncharacterized protein n=1 Tax=Neolewinella maritima TaxID=1383882 RepID=A0ABM9B092_9BACT|nr:hypothetical protein [Neolewinella maritima]CAH1000501.1 hypothetical protein LEM8419_01654 [Neolewinella maritima]
MPPPFSLTLPTPFGPAAFGIELTESGRVTAIQLPLEGLPETVYKLTYGASWRDARTYFLRLSETLTYRIEANLFATAPVEELAPLVAHYSEHAAPSEPVTDYATYWATHAQWIQVFAFRQRRVDKVLRKLARLDDRQQLQGLEPQLFDYLLNLLPLEFTRTSELVYETIGNFRTERARTYLLSELEREGRHPYTANLLRGLEHYSDDATRERLQTIYQRATFGDEQLTQYIRGLTRFDRDAVLPHLLAILTEHGGEVEAVCTVLYDFGYPTDFIAGQIIKQFEREQDYYVLNDLLQAALSVEGPLHIDLAAMNEKVSAATYTDLPPVNWPQQLESGWRELVRRSSYQQVMAVVSDSLISPVPRLQRNAVLQLKAYREDATDNPPLPYPIEQRMRELLASRYDKVYVEILNILGSRPTPELREPEQMLDAIMAISIGSRYRFVVLNALRRVGHTQVLRDRARRYYTAISAGTQDAELREKVTAWLPFLEKYLGDISSIREVLLSSGKSGAAG